MPHPDFWRILMQGLPRLGPGIAIRDGMYVFDPESLTPAQVSELVTKLNVEGVVPRPDPEGLRWLKADRGEPVTWCVNWEGAIPFVSREDMLAEMHAAFDTWTDECSLILQEVSLGSPCDLEIGFADIDGDGGTLGFVFQPASGTSMRACGAECGDYTLEPTGDWTAIDFFNIFLHETGHALGLPHIEVAGNVMYPSYAMGTPRFTLGPQDVAEITQRYP